MILFFEVCFVSKLYGLMCVFDEVCVVVVEGEVYVFFGVNGVGKLMFVKVFGGVEMLDLVEVFLCGECYEVLMC